MTTAVQTAVSVETDPARAKTRAGRVYLYLVPAAILLVASSPCRWPTRWSCPCKKASGSPAPPAGRGSATSPPSSLVRFLADSLADDHLDSRRGFPHHSDVDRAGIPTQTSISGPAHFHGPF